MPADQPGPADGAYGPSGYLPDRAARRARKIVLREQMGVGWPLASLLAGVVLLIVGVVYVLTQLGPPGEPFVAVTDLAGLDPDAVVAHRVDAQPVLLVRAGGGVRAFAGAPEDRVRLDPASRRLAAGDTRWDLDGRRVSGTGEDLTPVPVTVHDGVVYVDATAAGAPASSGAVDQTRRLPVDGSAIGARASAGWRSVRG